MIRIMSQAQPSPSDDRVGALPAKQARSRRTRDQLLAAGYSLVEARDFEAMSIADIAKAAGCSVGAFYYRFADKEAFFRAMIAHRLEEARRHVGGLLAVPDGTDPLETVVGAVAETFRRRPGFLRAALRKSMEDPSAWEPMRAHGHFVADQFLERLSRDAGRRPAPHVEQRIRFAFQIMNGTLINALINAPGPLRLDHPALTRELLRAMRLVIDAGD
ncbi:TetR/AcrR family transcriptional regulator [Vineibacter terrae]|uniref:TetR/AcrR family transcriptional regulator n=2 Tax=Vineibacter terrae TaxID=2586908 RepID=A0A5C8PGM0_9HYPH|nr:TetR/AcrR family transcriptional regulator [Vineibacter terrae]